eukprot:1503431-Pleurochrysis_carterae.AAC.4
MRTHRSCNDPEAGTGGTGETHPQRQQSDKDASLQSRCTHTRNGTEGKADAERYRGKAGNRRETGNKIEQRER